MDLVTGGAGFVGSYLAKQLLEMGRDVRVFDIEQSKYIPAEVEFHQGDMRDYTSVRKALEGIDVVYHLAFVQAFSKRPEKEKWEINYGGTENFLKASVDEDIGRFVHTSTVEVYSPNPPFRAPEEASTDRPFGWYGRHKRACEELCWYYHRKFGLPVTMVRLPTICGRGYYVRIDLLRVFDWLLANRPLLWFGGDQIKGDFIWIEDCVQGFILCGTGDGAVGEVFNISCSEPSSALEIIETLKEVAGNTRKLRLVPPRLAWPPVKMAARLGVMDMPSEQLTFLTCDNSYSIEKARRILGYNPRMNAAEATAELLKGYMEDREYVKGRALDY